MTGSISAADAAYMLARTATIWEALRGARLFMTGGTGFVGTWLLEALIAANRAHDLEIEAVVLTRDPRAYRTRAPHIADAGGITLLAGDATEFAFPDGAFSHVIHAATQGFYRADSARPLSILADDALATRRVLEFCAAAGVRRLLFTSSGAIYGPQPPHCAQLAETDAYAPDVTDPGTVYGQSKRLSEFSCIAYANANGFAVTIARLFAFIGPHLPLDAGYAAGNFIRDVSMGDSIRIAGDGTPLRSYLYAADLAVWLWHILLRGQPGRAYNVGSPHAISIAGLADVVAETAPNRPPIVTARKPVPGAPPLRYVPSTQRARSELALDVGIDLQDAVRRTLAWHVGAGAAHSRPLAFNRL